MNQPAFQHELAKLASQIETLAEQVQQLSDENRSLKHHQAQWLNERANLVSKNDEARIRVEAMISRLKSLEQNA